MVQDDCLISNLDLQLVLPLPGDFRPADSLTFFRRDPQEIAERVTAHGLHKALLWRGQPACLSVDFRGAQAHVRLARDGVCPEPGNGAEENALRHMVRRMLGLDQDLDGFMAGFGQHPELASLLAQQRGLRVPATATPFEALAWAITGQQISVAVAVALRRKLIQAGGQVHSSGLFCHPDAASLTSLSFAELREMGFSTAKAQALLSLAEQVAAGELPLDEWAQQLDAERVELIRSRLLAIKGIGPWTVNYALLRGFGWLDGSLHGDVAVRRSLQNLLGKTEKPDEKFTQHWLTQFSPWRALVAAHLWASLTMTTY